ncbi:5-methyltetrahydropteroyltriglutamate--homocysteine S-methyltransferase [Ornithinibacillus gellani]|uniref:5-methyltetrahydropteroyltriglutamate-- homocysteine S-methyltransferase n=1 Tax=Ornithinibacillus gellani TaxID=2293253 RepID=UPI000F468EB5|nr:5-methyltetrahydropteroyltriglutamate--homocysteine S-methyltransferase [Ornithinibacillus gellani]TQS74615.1 5-methyltetrahydropteroyltriglutamate--homocysteine S-methyltransferase [Ornithinibacillus gellani]
MTTIKSSNLGYPRIGENREWKRALENFWNGNISEQELIHITDEIRLHNLKKQKQQGIDLIPVGDFSLYDHVLDTSISFGVVPERFSYEGGKVDLDTYFAIARGVDDAVASEMTKWFNTNYHYIVPELNGMKPSLVENRALTYYNEAKEKLGIDGKPVILGPITYISLSKGYDGSDFEAVVDTFLPLYTQVLQELADAGATWVQLDEPIFSTDVPEEIIRIAEKVYNHFANQVPAINIIFQTYFEKVFHYDRIKNLPVKGIGLDFVHGDSLKLLTEYGFPKDKVLAAGIVDGRNVWLANLEDKLSLLETIKRFVHEEQLIVQPSSSLLHVPVTKSLEKKLDQVILDGLSFADDKIHEVVTLTKGIKSGRHAIAKEIESATAALNNLHATYRSNQSVRNKITDLTSEDASRDTAFPDRIKTQQESLKLPLLPTTTIGSLPQTPEVRSTRTKWRKGKITDAAYEQFVKGQIQRWITIQEELDIDVLVHGEFERNDMVEYFGEKLKGFSVTEYGWVQSYGSRCVKPPLIFGDVSWEQPITVKESVFAQSLTERTVKGMLTGPVTILNWSFVHDTTPRYDIMKQIALALQKEIEALEENGIKIIQVDEPALREGLPLNQEKWKKYLDASAYAFRLATATVKAGTQIHTHMCYSNFEDIFDCIDALDADVISIETSRSHGELVSTFEQNTYTKEIGLGVYDIHSPRIPSVEEVKANIERALQSISPTQFWVNPDCGLKTRKEPETIDALKVMVQAAKEVRQDQLTTLKQ